MLVVAQIGLGRWGQNIFRNLMELSKECSVKYACDASPEILKKFRTHFPRVNYVADPDVILKDRAVSAVLVATPAASHYQLVQKCLRAGKHVFVEKPITLKSREAWNLVELARKKKLKLMVGHLLVYHPAMPVMADLLRKGAIGPVLYYYFRRANLGVFRKHENVLWDASVHDLATLLFLLKGRLPETVSANGLASFRKNIEEVVMTTLNFRNNLKAFIFGSWLDPFKLRQTIIVGRRGMLVLDEHDRESKLKLYKKKAVFDKKTGDFKYPDDGVEFIPIPQEEPLRQECRHFFQAVNGGVLLTDGLSGWRVLKILEAAEKSLKSAGTLVSLEKK